MSWIDQRPDDAMDGAFTVVGPETVRTVEPAAFREPVYVVVRRACEHGIASRRQGGEAGRVERDLERFHLAAHGVHLHHAAVGQDPLPRLHQHRMVLRPAHQLQRQVRLHAQRDIRRPAGIDAPTAIFVLVSKNLVDRPLHAAAIARAQQHVHKDVVGLEHGVGFEFATPVALRMLQPEQPILGFLNAGNNVVEAKIQAAETRLRGRFRACLGYGPRIDG